jgi:small subunit ribosomal protein S24e
MEIKIIEERTNPLLKRHEFRFEVAHATAATPNRDSVRTELAKAVNAPKDRVIIERMIPRFGTAVTRGEANVYDSADAAKAISRDHILVRNGLKEKEAKGPAPAAPETPKTDAPAAADAEPPAPPAAKPHAEHAAPPAAKPHAEHAAPPAAKSHAEHTAPPADKPHGEHAAAPAAKGHAEHPAHPKDAEADAAAPDDAPKKGKAHPKKE